MVSVSTDFYLAQWSVSRLSILEVAGSIPVGANNTKMSKSMKVRHSVHGIARKPNILNFIPLREISENCF